MINKLFAGITLILYACSSANPGASLADAADTTDAAELTKQLTVEIADGLNLKVSIDTSGGVRILHWPEVVTSTVSLVGKPSSIIAGSFDTTRCANVKTNLGTVYKSTLTTQAQRQAIWSQVRSTSSFSLHIALHPLAQTEWLLRKIEDASQKNGLSFHSLYFLESVKFENYKLTANFDKDAITPLFGNEQDLAKSFELAVINDILPSAETTIQFSAYDFMCDLLNPCRGPNK